MSSTRAFSSYFFKKLLKKYKHFKAYIDNLTILEINKLI